jgi:hypothetical protein
LNYLNFSRIRLIYKDYKSRVTIFVFKTIIDISCILRLDLIVNSNAQLIVIDNKILDTSIALLYIYNKKS